ncbi:MAG: DUF2157 domain-containing protein [Candidatus Nitronauta litoralis]|uniref:DUF2157 domain-containing protein n=1 Tax=Candidatus Nitronauta litoralis TaxID=2705533 RepID=A0A7T0FZK1_9BACT|nr:MAG: DUF2157 domain-containing protein [Candidatus Nitronauta litoralis]
MARIDKKIEEWVRADLINSDVADSILSYEDRQPASSWILSTFLILGAVTVGIGIISLIAANWDDIPDSVKLAADLILLSALAYGVFKTHVEDKPLYFEMYLVAFQISCLASIGLISQIYNTGGKAWQALLLWSVITAGVAVASKKSFVPFIWATGFFAGVINGAFEIDWLKSFYKGQEQALIMTIPLLATLMTALLKKVFGESGQTHALRVWSFLALIFTLVTIEVINSSDFYNNDNPGISLVAFAPGYILAILVGIAFVRDEQFNRLQIWVSLFALFGFVIQFHLSFLYIKSDYISAIFTLLILSLIAILMASRRHRKIFQVLVVFIGLRFLVLYFQALGGLATTGIGLIVSGVLIICMVTWWNKKRQAIANWAEGLLT